MIFAFDVDGTLFDLDEQPRYAIIALAQACMEHPNIDVIIWSGGGIPYAQARARERESWALMRISTSL